MNTIAGAHNGASLRRCALPTYTIEHAKQHFRSTYAYTNFVRPEVLRVVHAASTKGAWVFVQSASPSINIKTNVQRSTYTENTSQYPLTLLATHPLPTMPQIDVYTEPPPKPADIPLRIYSNPICPFAQVSCYLCSMTASRPGHGYEANSIAAYIINFKTRAFLSTCVCSVCD